MIAKISGYILYLFSVLVYRTCRFTLTGYDQIENILDSGVPMIITSWHGMTMMVAGFLRKKMDITSFAVIMPDDHRGKVLKVFARKLDTLPIPLNLSGDETFGTGRKLVHLVRLILKGKNFLIHPDGPAGPAYKVKPGLSYIAQKSGATIIPLGCYCRHSYHVPRWDRYTLPLPFSKVHVQIGPPLLISKDTEDLGETNQYIEDLLNRLKLKASANYYEL